MDINIGSKLCTFRDKYKRMSRLLEDRDTELEREKRELRRVHKEFQELEEFARLESETGVMEDRRTSRLVSTVSIEDLVICLGVFRGSVCSVCVFCIALLKEFIKSVLQICIHLMRIRIRPFCSMQIFEKQQNNFSSKIKIMKFSF